MSEAEQSLEVREAQILQEIKALEEQDPKALHVRFNNFWIKMLHPEVPNDDGSTHELTISRAGKKLRDMIGPVEASRYSEKRLEQTDTEFFAAVDSVMNQLDPDHSIRNEILATTQIRQEIDISNPQPQTKKGDARSEAIRAINIKLIPAYTRLRAMGYVDADIT